LKKLCSACGQSANWIPITLRLTSIRSHIQNLQNIYKDIAPGISLADELIQEQHQEASA
jgi:hypothetical protein